MFKALYAKFAKNCALDAVSFGGVYIAGGIAQKNSDIFDGQFIRIFENSEKMQEVLKKIPIYLIKNYKVGLLGAGFVCGKGLARSDKILISKPKSKVGMKKIFIDSKNILGLRLV